MNFAEYKKAEKELLALPSIKGYMQKKRHPSFYLERTRKALELLKHPEKDLQFIHVGGTAGKGSVTLYTHHILHAAKKRVGSFISPHVTTIAERTIINTKLVSVDDFVWAWKKLKPITEKMAKSGKDYAPSFFEANFLLSLLLFKKHRVEWAVVEVGCGGEFDATNIIPAPRVAVITNVHLDHTHILGRTRKRIALTKAGIIKTGSQVLTGEHDPAIRSILQDRAKKVGATFSYVRKPQLSPKYTNQRMCWKDKRLGALSSSLLGQQFVHNAKLASEICTLLGVTKKAQREGIAQTRIPGRSEIIATAPTVLLDGAHNPAKLSALLSSIQAMPRQHASILFGVGKLKQAKQLLKLIATKADDITFTRSTTHYPEPASPKHLQQMWKSLSQKPSRVVVNPKKAIKKVLADAKHDTLVVVTGSLYLVGDIRKHWITEKTILKHRNLFIS